jgi:hypothetical protein
MGPGSALIKRDSMTLKSCHIFFSGANAEERLDLRQRLFSQDGAVPVGIVTMMSA